MEIIGERIIIRPLELEDVFHMRTWGTHKNPLLEDYNFPDMTDKEIKKWYDIKTKSFFNKYFGILTRENKLIGYMGMKEIKYLKKESTLGIVLDPNFLDMGYGSEVLECFLKEYFTAMQMKVMYLEVAEFNRRATRVYEKMGFKNVGYYLEEFFDDQIDTETSYFKDSKSYFVISDGKVYNYIHKMKLKKDDFLINRLKK